MTFVRPRVEHGPRSVTGAAPDTWISLRSADAGGSDAKRAGCSMADIIEFPHNDLVVQMMHRYNIPMTRENYLQIAYGGDLPDPWTAAHEDELPAALQDWSKVYFVPGKDLSGSSEPGPEWIGRESVSVVKQPGVRTMPPFGP
jgi:hypothetical protein